jgi:DNA repair protein RecN (Recombination protein N)
MLLHLSVENFILIRQLDIDFEDGFSVITGETGAGKSILVGALGLILGQRADTMVLHDKGKKCIVEGNFRIESYGLEAFFASNDLDFEPLTTIRREITPQGKTRAFINDTPVNLAVLNELGDRLVDIHSQNQTLELNEASFQLSLVDSYAAKPQLLLKYSQLYSQFIKTKNDLEELKQRHNKANADRDYRQFLFEELQQAAIREGEMEETEAELTILNHSEEIKSRLFSVLNLLSENETNIISQVTHVRQQIDQASHYGATLSQVSERLGASLIELKDISAELNSYIDHVNYDPERIDYLTSRVDLINHLLMKHKVASSQELKVIMDQLSLDLNNIESLNTQIEKLSSSLEVIESELRKAAEELSESRENVIPRIEDEMVNTLSELGMHAAIFKVEHQVNGEFTKTGIDKVIFLFSANRGSQPRELQKVASGGELSRLMLAVKSLVLSRNLLPTILFDEIDSGVSGEIAGRIGTILHKMARTMQVIAITLLPQIAGKCNTHYLAYKEEGESAAFSSLRRLSNEERIDEIARMLSDDKITATSKAAAQELIRK